jgi:hypothetical protein
MTISARDILPVAIDRANLQDEIYSRQYKVCLAANSLWSDEYHAWKALIDLGLRDAAECAWQRRTAACDLATILFRSM